MIRKLRRRIPNRAGFVSTHGVFRLLLAPVTCWYCHQRIKHFRPSIAVRIDKNTIVYRHKGCSARG